MVVVFGVPVNDVVAAEMVPARDQNVCVQVVNERMVNVIVVPVDVVVV